MKRLAALESENEDSMREMTWIRIMNERMENDVHGGESPGYFRHAELTAILLLAAKGDYKKKKKQKKSEVGQ